MFRRFPPCNPEWKCVVSCSQQHSIVAPLNSTLRFIQGNVFLYPLWSETTSTLHFSHTCPAANETQLDSAMTSPTDCAVFYLAIESDNQHIKSNTRFQTKKLKLMNICNQNSAYLSEINLQNMNVLANRREMIRIQSVYVDFSVRTIIQSVYVDIGVRTIIQSIRCYLHNADLLQRKSISTNKK